MIHVSDWLPTLFAAAGGDTNHLPEDLDGINLWKSLVEGDDEPVKNEDCGEDEDRSGDEVLKRKEMIYGLNPTNDPRLLGFGYCGGAIRYPTLVLAVLIL